MPYGYEKEIYYSPHELMVGSGLVLKNGNPNKQVYSQWLFKGIIKAKLQAEGAGTWTFFDFDNILLVDVIIKLRRFQLPLKVASIIADQVIELKKKRKKNDSPLVTVYPVEAGRFEVVLGADNSQPLAIVLDVVAASKDVNKRLKPLVMEQSKRIEKELEKAISISPVGSSSKGWRISDTVDNEKES